MRKFNPAVFVAMVGTIVVLTATISALEELDFTIERATAQGAVTQVEDVYQTERSTGTSNRARRRIDYQYYDVLTKSVRRGSDEVSDDWPMPSLGQKIAVEYVPGDSSRSRLAGHANWVVFPILLIAGYITLRAYRACAAQLADYLNAPTCWRLKLESTDPAATASNAQDRI